MSTITTTTTPLAGGLAGALADRKTAARARYREIILVGTDESDELAGILSLLGWSDTDLASDEEAARTVAELEPGLPALEAERLAANVALREAGESRITSLKEAESEYFRKKQAADAAHAAAMRRHDLLAETLQKNTQAVARARATATRIFG